MENVLGIHGSHDASFTFIDKNDKLRVIEIERIVKKDMLHLRNSTILRDEVFLLMTMKDVTF